MKTKIKQKFVLYDSTDDSIVLHLVSENVLLFNTKKEAKKYWSGYPEQILKVKELPKHQQEYILTETN